MAEDEVTRTGANSWTTLAVVCLVSAVMALNMSSLNVALPTITRELDATAVQGSWLLLSYMVASTASLMFFGRLSDAWGQRPLYIGGLVTFSVASLLCGFAPSIEVLIGLRVISALGGAVLLGNGATLIHQAFPPRAIGSAMGFYAASFPAANLVGPTLGGFVVDLVGWPWVFWFNVPLCVLALVAGIWLLPAGDKRQRTLGLDLPGNALVVAIVLSLTLGITLAQEVGWTSPVVYGSLVVAAALLPMLRFAERRSDAPVLQMRVFARVGRLFLAGFFNGAGRFPMIVLASVYLQAVLGFGAGRAGLLILPMPVGSILASMTIGRLSRRRNAREIMLIGAVVGTAGVMLCTAAVALGTVAGLLPALLVVGVGTGLFIGSNATALLEASPPDAIGVVNATRLMVQNTGNVLSLAVAMTLLTVPVSGDVAERILSATLVEGTEQQAVPGFLMACGLLVVLGLAGVWFSYSGARRGTGVGSAAALAPPTPRQEPPHSCPDRVTPAADLADPSSGPPR